MAWRKKREELQLLTKGKKESAGWRMVSFLAPICYKEGVICCKQHHGSMAGELFSDYVYDKFILKQCKS